MCVSQLSTRSSDGSLRSFHLPLRIFLFYVRFSWKYIKIERGWLFSTALVFESFFLCIVPRDPLRKPVESMLRLWPSIGFLQHRFTGWFFLFLSFSLSFSLFWGWKDQGWKNRMQEGNSFSNGKKIPRIFPDRKRKFPIFLFLENEFSILF